MGSFLRSLSPEQQVSLLFVVLFGLLMLASFVLLPLRGLWTSLGLLSALYIGSGAALLHQQGVRMPAIGAALEGMVVAAYTAAGALQATGKTDFLGRYGLDVPAGDFPITGVSDRPSPT